MVRLEMIADIACSLDEAWLFNLDEGALSWVDTSSDGDDICALQLNAPTLDQPRPEFGIATATTDWLNGRNADHRVKAWSSHLFEPGLTSVFTVTTGTANAQVKLTYPPRWHTHART